MCRQTDEKQMPAVLLVSFAAGIMQSVKTRWFYFLPLRLTRHRSDILSLLPERHAIVPRPKKRLSCEPAEQVPFEEPSAAQGWTTAAENLQILSA